jgi:hypothetical protein
MNICPKELQLLLEEIDRLRRENAMLREAAGIHISDNEDCDAIQVTVSVKLCSQFPSGFEMV